MTAPRDAPPPPETPLPETWVIQRSVLVSSRRRFAYLQAPKAACTSVVWALWSLSHRLGDLADPPPPGGLHDPHLPIWDADVTLAAAPEILRFTMARNPYARALSAYLDKMRRPGDPNRRRFLRLAGLPEDAEVNFRAFLETLAERPDILRSDRHWMPQHEATLFDFLALDVVARVESFGRDMSGLTRRIFSAPPDEDDARPTRAHGTGAVGRLASAYSESERALVRTLYARDFELFAYPDDPSRQTATGPARISASGAHMRRPEFIARLSETAEIARRQAAWRDRKVQRQGKADA